MNRRSARRPTDERIGMILTPLLPLLAALQPSPTAMALQPSTASRFAIRASSSPAMMAKWTQADMQAARLPLPAEVDELLSEDTSRENTELLWAAFRECFATEADAVAAARRNTGTILPYLNVPSNIRGSFGVLVDLLGDEAAARDVCAKNPGVLQCRPASLARESAESIVRAADQVDSVEGVLGAMPPALRQNLDKVAFFLLALPIAKRLADCSGATCG